MTLDDFSLRLNLLFRRYRAVKGIGKAERVGDTWEEIVNPNKPPIRYIVSEVKPREGDRPGTDMSVDEYDPDFNFGGFWTLSFLTVAATIITIWLL